MRCCVIGGHGNPLDTQDSRSHLDLFEQLAEPGLLNKAHLLRWRPRLHARRTGSTPRVQRSGAASHLDLFEQLAEPGLLNKAQPLERLVSAGLAVAG
jgi:hypothetical protein